MFRRHRLLSVFTLGYLAVVGWITLGPQPVDDRADGLLWKVLGFAQSHPALTWLTYSRVEFTANILMFVPIGLFFLLLVGRRLWMLAITLGFGLTCAIETAQLFLPGRVSDVRDIASNSAGAAIGVAVAVILTARGEREHRRREAALTTAPPASRPLVRR